MHTNPASLRSEDAAAGAAGSSSPAVPPLKVTVVTSEHEFAAIFVHESASPNAPSKSRRPEGTGTKHSSDAFLLCYEHPGDGVTADGLSTFQKSVTAAAQQHGTALQLFLWDCSGPAFAPARAQLDKTQGHPLLLIIYRGAIADTVRGMPLADMASTEVPRVCSRLASYQRSAKPARVVVSAPSRDTPGTIESTVAEAEPHLAVDVAKVVGMGKKLMAERKPFYAEKFFVKALHTLDALAAEVDRLVTSREDYDGSVAMCLAWAGLAQLVQAKATVDNPCLTRLTTQPTLQRYAVEPLSDANRAVTTWRLMLAAPRTWCEAEASEATLRAALTADPQDTAARSLLVTTLFLQDDLERAMTEALKLHVAGNSYGRVALTHMSAFLGHDHVLVQRLGMPALAQAV